MLKVKFFLMENWARSWLVNGQPLKSNYTTMNIYISSELWTEKCVLMLSLSICFRFDFVGCQRLVCLSRLVSGLKSAIISVFNHRLRETIRYNFDSSLFAIKLCCQNFLNVPL